MTENFWALFDPERDLRIERWINAPSSLVFEAWTKPEHVVHWFTPAPWKTADCRIDLRPGGEYYVEMESPDGKRFPNPGSVLAVETGRYLVTTDALLAGFRPAEEVFLTSVMTFDDKDGGTLYRAHAMHANAAGRQRHQDMGFEHGWASAAAQLAAYTEGLTGKAQ